MGVATGSGLATRFAVIDTFMQYIIDEVGAPPVGAGAVISRDRSTANEQWLTMPANRSASGKAMLFGHRQDTSDSSNAIFHNCSNLDFATASAADTRDFDKFDGQPSDSQTDDGASNEKEAPNSNGFDIATPYLRHWILSNPNFGALVAGNYAPGERTYVYMVVEVAENVYRIFGHADVIQLGTWTDALSGFYQFGTYIQDGSFLGAPGAGRSNIFMGANNSRPDRPAVAVPGGGGAEGKPNCLFQPDRDGMTRPWVSADTFTFSAGSSMDRLMANDPRYVGADHNINPGAFSGVALRTPMYLYGTNTTAAQKATSISFSDPALRIQLLGEVPDAFFCNIRDLDPGTVFVDGVDRYLVLPLYEKGGLSANFGILLRNPDL